MLIWRVQLWGIFRMQIIYYSISSNFNYDDWGHWILMLRHFLRYYDNFHTSLMQSKNKRLHIVSIFVSSAHFNYPLFCAHFEMIQEWQMHFESPSLVVIVFLNSSLFLLKTNKESNTEIEEFCSKPKKFIRENIFSIFYNRTFKFTRRKRNKSMEELRLNLIKIH